MKVPAIAVADKAIYIWFEVVNVKHKNVVLKKPRKHKYPSFNLFFYSPKKPSPKFFPGCFQIKGIFHDIPSTQVVEHPSACCTPGTRARKPAILKCVGKCS